MEKFEHIGESVLGMSILLVNYFGLLHYYVYFGLFSYFCY